MTSSKGTGAGLQDRTEHLRAAGELTTDDLEHVSGGRGTPKLLEAAIKGQVFKKVEIHGTA